MHQQLGSLARSKLLLQSTILGLLLLTATLTANLLAPHGLQLAAAGSVPGSGQGIVQVSPQYLNETVATSTISTPDTSPVSAADLGVSPGDAQSTLTVPAFRSFALATVTTPPLYDVAVNFVSLNGNIPTVPGCNLNPSGFPRSFFDNFNDGLIDSGCTAHFFKLGTSTESGSSLHMNSTNAATINGFLVHALAYDTTLKSGQGNFTAGADFRLDAYPSESGGTAYGVIFANRSPHSA